jgi:glycosyltransferase involved in cell wall biosynthesis
METAAPRYVDDNGCVQMGVTVVIPCYNQEVFLFECLNSIVAQTTPAWEAFVVDDCSPARIADRIVSSYNDPRIRSIRHETNLGLAASRNTGLRAGHAPFALCVDADDFLDPEFLSATLEAIESRSTDCAYTEFQLIGVSNDVWWTQEPKSAGELAQEQWLPGPGVMMRRSVWEKVGGYSPDLRYNEDWDFWIAAMELGVSVARVPRPLYFYRRHAQSMIATQAQNEWITREVILKKRATFFAIGDRARTFRAGGLVSSAYAHRALGNRWLPIVLMVRAVSIDRDVLKLLFRESRVAVRRRLRPLGRLKRAARSIISGVGHGRRSVDRLNGDPPNPLEARRDWDSLASGLHERYGYLSHDYAVLGQVIDRTGARFILEIGCGSGRLVPVYLMHNVQTIWLQDVSGRALDLCRQRFLCQQQIRYFGGNVQSISSSTTVDLIVANRVLQHILDDAEFAETLAYLAAMTRYFYINETGIEEAIRHGDPNLKGRDYARIFSDLGWRVEDRGDLTAEHGTRQFWLLFTK